MSEPTRENFEKLLSWLDPDVEKAGEKYERIRLRIIRVFSCHEFCEPEELADETINRVTVKIDSVTENYVGDPALYFYGVAKNVYKEQLKKRRPAPPPPPPNPEPDELEEVCTYLDECLAELASADRDLILKYHEGEKGVKIRNRKDLATTRKMSPNALRIKAFNLHARLRECIEARRLGTKRFRGRSHI